MKRFFLCFIIFVFLAGCAGELPPSPPAPGPSDLVGKAAGIAIPMSKMPSWAAQPSNIRVYPSTAGFSDSVMITVGDVYAYDNFEYVYSKGYVYDKSMNSWARIDALEAESGPKEKNWAQSRAGFLLDITKSRFDPGMQYALFYACDKVGDEWDCNNGVGNTGKWMLVAFEVVDYVSQLEELSDYLIEEDIGDFDFIESDVEGDGYVAVYEDGAMVEVTVTPYDSFEDLLDDVDEAGTWMRVVEGVCGFYRVEDGDVIFWWVSDDTLVQVLTFDSSLATRVIEEYGEEYAADCDLDDELEDEDIPFCGDDNRDPSLGEECDGSDDDACPGQCRSDCSCPPASGTQPVCGDNIREGDEECEFDYHCGAGEYCDDCECKPRPDCGNDDREANEECDGTDDANCGPDEVCSANCLCVPVQPVCGDNVREGNEDCDGTDDAACPGNCLANCSCPVCGNNVKERGEDCDGTDDIACPGNCLANCSCPAAAQAVCGNDVRESGEECDGTDDAACASDELCIDCECVKVDVEQPGLADDAAVDADLSEVSVLSGDGETDADLDDALPYYAGMAFKQPEEGENMDDFLIFGIAALAILIITIINFVELRK